MTGFLSDVRYALRLLARNRGFAATAILTLALGVAANGAIFAVVHAVLFRAPVYPDAGRVVALTRQVGARADDNHSAAEFLDLRRESRSFSALSAYRQDILDLAGRGGDPERVPGAQVSVSFFDVFGVPPILGRTFSEGRDDPRGERLVVLGHGLWQRRFGGDPAVVGQTLRINRETFTVVGVMPPAFQLPGDAEAWMLAPGAVPTPPIPVEGDYEANRDVHYLEAVGRLAPGVSVEQAGAELGAIGRRMAERFPRPNPQAFGVASFREQETGGAREGLLLLLSAVAFVLLVACANIAGLMLARAAGRRQELAVRAALGAGRGRLARQLLVESLAVGLAGGALGLLLAWWGVDLLLGWMPPDFPRVGAIGLDATVTLFTLALAVGASLLFGVLPAAQAARAGLLPALRTGELRVAGRASRRTMSALVVVEVALGVVLAAGAGLMVGTLAALRQVDPGYAVDGVVRVPLPLPATRYGTSEQQAEFYSRLLERLAGDPATRLSAAVFPPPLSGASASGGVEIEGRDAASDAERPIVSVSWVSPGYFRVMGIPLRRGRDFDGRDAGGAPDVAVIGETAAARFWPGENPIGQRFRFDGEDWVTVAGVVGDVRQSALGLSPQPMVYVPIRQTAVPLMTIMVRTAAGVGPVASAVRAAVRQLDPDLPVGRVALFSDYVADSVGGPRLRAVLLSAFAAAALLLAAIGVYGLLSYSVAQRAREIGVRLALGASPRQVYREVVAGGVKLALAGLALGIPAALGLSRLVASQLFGVGAWDPATFAGVAVLLLAVALAASIGPARRVLSMDPASVLRAE